MILLAIDPGPEKSGWVQYDTDTKEVLCSGINENSVILTTVMPGLVCDRVVIEMIASYGMPVGASVFETCVWIGRFTERWQGGLRVERIYRQAVKLHLCGTPRAKDSNIRQAIMDRYGSARMMAIGTKKSPGPLYGIKGDMWAALAAAITFEETR